MLSETLASGLEAYRIGPKVRALRLRKQLGLVQLGDHTGLSPAMLSKIERGQSYPTLPTLLRIAMVFGVGLEHFFVEDKEKPLVSIVRKKDRLRLPDRDDADLPSYLFESLDYPVTDRKLAGYYAKFPARAQPSAHHQHGEVELIYVVKGRLALEIDDERHILREGDAVYFDSTAPHSYCQDGRVACEAVIVVSL